MRYFIAAILAAAALAGTVHAQPPSGTAVVATKDGAALAADHIRASGTISAIDKEKRAVTIKGDGGNEVVVEAGPEVQNFDKLAVGQRVDFEYLESLTLELKKGKDVVVARTETGEVARAEPGAMPGAARGHEIRITAEVVAVDAATRTVTLKGPNRTVELEIADPEQFAQIAKGDHIEATYTEATAIKVSPAP